MTRRGPRDEGSAIVEFTYLAVLLLIPLVYIMLSVFQVQRAAFGVTAAAREAGRAYVTATDANDARARAEDAITIALRDQGLDRDGLGPVRVVGNTSLTPPDDAAAGPSTVTVRLRYVVRLPVLGSLFAAAVIPVSVEHTETIDRYRAR
ncbi:MAG: hypothetical protein LC640_13175 [Frankia sp.]|nr:hypothetical protein [Frankia sp.]